MPRKSASARKQSLERAKGGEERKQSLERVKEVSGLW
jgi:hypothetical protein